MNTRDDTYEKALYVRLQDWLYERIVRAAEDKDVSMAEIVREAVKRHVADY